MSLWRRVYVERRRVVLPLVLFLAANVALLALGVWPLRQSVVRAQDDAMEARNTLAAAMLQGQQARTARTSTDNAGTELGTFYADVLPSNLQEAGSLLMYWLERTARAAGVTLNASAAAYDEVRESRLTKLVNTAVMTGQYADILRFLHAVEVASEFVIIEKVELSQSTTGRSGSDSILELNLNVATYFIVEPPPGITPAGAGGGN